MMSIIRVSVAHCFILLFKTWDATQVLFNNIYIRNSFSIDYIILNVLTVTMIVLL